MICSRKSFRTNLSGYKAARLNTRLSAPVNKPALSEVKGLRVLNASNWSLLSLCDQPKLLLLRVVA